MPSNASLSLQLFLQLAVILATCRIVGRLLRFLGQPQVVGEMIAGILLGPSFLGILAPAAQHYLFPKTILLHGSSATALPHPSMSILYAVSQIGLVLYMFLVGLNLDSRLFARHGRAAASISISGILVPVVLGGALGYALSGKATLFPAGIGPTQAALFVAAAMAITAFPVLARILHEKGLTRTYIGTLALGAAAIGDAAAWCLLACVLATVNASTSTAALAIGGGLGYALVTILLVRPRLAWFDRVTRRDGEVRTGTLSLAILLVMLCAWITDAVGIHAVFGAFIAGAVMPRGPFCDGVRQDLEKLTVSLLVPIFFVYAGLSTRISLLMDPALLRIALLALLVAFASKGLGCMVASRLAGTSWREAAAIGSLMNARGMMELILATIALDRGLITPGLFTILVLIAVLTTVAASPLFQLLYRPERQSAPQPTVTA